MWRKPRRIARLAATAALTAGLVAAVPGPATAAASTGDGPALPGRNLYAIYPTKGECLAVGTAGVHVQWDEFECLPWVEPLAAPAAESDDTEWALWTVVYV
jgi:hypothetical protein